MDEYGYSVAHNRPIDIVFVGGFSRHHARRAAILDVLSRHADRWNIALHLDCSRLTKWAESPLGMCMPLRRYRRPSHILGVSHSPVFGVDLYSTISRATIVLNGAVDMAGDDRGNMRCFESLGLGALLVSDAVDYPVGMVNGDTMLTYNDDRDVVAVIEGALGSPDELSRIARRGREMVRRVYNKSAQWNTFQRLVASL